MQSPNQLSDVSLPDLESDGRIPKILHQIYVGGPLPERFSTHIARLRVMHSDWAYRFYDDAAAEHFIAEQYDDAMLTIYRSISPLYGAARADFLRYLILYRLGGVYLDVKSMAEVPLDGTIAPEDSFILSKWRNRRGEVHNGFGLHPELWSVPGGEFQQWFLACAPGHPLMRSVIERVIRNITRYSVLRDGVGFSAVVRVTGPIAYTKAVAPLLKRYPCRRVANETVLGLRYSTLDGETHRRITGRYDQLRVPLVTIGVNRIPLVVVNALQWARERFRRAMVTGPRLVIEPPKKLKFRQRHQP